MQFSEFYTKNRSRLVDKITANLNIKTPWRKMLPFIPLTGIYLACTLFDTPFFKNMTVNFTFFHLILTIPYLFLFVRYLLIFLKLCDYKSLKDDFMEIYVNSENLVELKETINMIKHRVNNTFDNLDEYLLFDKKKFNNSNNEIQLTEEDKKEFFSSLNTQEKNMFINFIKDGYDFDYEVIDLIKTQIDDNNNIQSTIKNLEKQFNFFCNDDLDDSKELEVNDINYKQLL